MSIDGGTLLLILAALLFVVALQVALVVFGFILAPKAARGSSTAMGWWIAILVLEGLQVLGSLASIVRGRFSVFTLLTPAIVAGQLATYFQARRNAGL